MEKQKLVTFSIITLLLINLGTLGFLLFFGPKKGPFPPDGGRPKPREIIIEQLHFDSQQQEKYKILIDQHRKQIDKTEQNIKKTKNELYLLLKPTLVDETKKDSLINKLVQFQKEIELIHFNHFNEIKKLCKPNQIEDFNNLTEELCKLFSHPRKPIN